MRFTVTPHRGASTTAALVSSVLAATPAVDGTLTVSPDGVTSADGHHTTVGYAPPADLWATEIAVSLAGTRFVAHSATESSPVVLPLVGERHVIGALGALAAGIASGISLGDAAAALAGPTLAGPAEREPGNLETLAVGAGVTLLTDGYDLTPLSTTEALKTLAEITANGARSIAVLGELDLAGLSDPQDVRDEHDRIGRLVVRLNISRLIVVGQSARHIHNAAGLEGSWDGESVLVETADQAYDLLNETELFIPVSNDGVVVLVKLPASESLRELGVTIGSLTA